MAKTKFLTSALCALLLAVPPAFAQNIDFDGNRFPCISYNIEQAQAGGQTNALTRTTSRATINRHRRASCGPTRGAVGRINRAGGLGTPASCDEYPFASATQGGAGADILIVPAQENSRQGADLRNFYAANGIGNGGGYTVSTSNVPVVGPNRRQLRIIPVRGGFSRCYRR